MEIEQRLRVTLSFEYRVFGENRDRITARISLDDIDPLEEKLKEYGVSFDRENSTKILTETGAEYSHNITARLNEEAEGNLELIALRNDMLTVHLSDYDRIVCSDSTGGPSQNEEGVQATLRYRGSDQKEGRELLGSVANVIKEFYEAKQKSEYDLLGEAIQKMLDDEGKKE